ncbi:uncharacterized protein LOC106057468 [Biomphalaria glabrata]|uniref:Uncharacterized protein LOC106057468 n=1 Tax=Biomphalaria glabrata TaxID=6526 RepID=A0A9U8E2J8_BIOGL|nr:uncharacterized protein LOC106057468 [Biomphalaria glabrata]
MIRCSQFVLVYSVLIVLMWSAQIESKIYGTWITRYIQNTCRRSLCLFREHNCMNVTSTNYEVCNTVTSLVATQGCILRVCRKELNMVCAETSPGPEFTKVPADSCSIGQSCYMKNQNAGSPV